MVTSLVSCASTLLTVLFDSGATRSFVSTRMIDQLGRPNRSLDRDMHIILLCGDRVISRRRVRALLVTMDRRELYVDVIELPIDDWHT